MKIKKVAKIILIIIGILFPIIVSFILVINDVAIVWDSWGQHGDMFVYPDVGNYLLLIFFKLSIYLIPPILIAAGRTIGREKHIKNKHIYFLLNSLNIWFLALLVIKLLADTIFELDRVFSITIFNSIKDVQTLIGYILTLILKKTVKIEATIGDNNTEKTK
jgi:hypothetical protein